MPFYLYPSYVLTIHYLRFLVDLFSYMQVLYSNIHIPRRSISFNPDALCFRGGGFDIFISPASFLYIIYFPYFPSNYLSSLQLQTVDYAPSYYFFAYFLPFQTFFVFIKYIFFYRLPYIGPLLLLPISLSITSHVYTNFHAAPDKYVLMRLSFSMYTFLFL